MREGMKRLPLRGIRALELAEIWAGPFCGVLLGDMGAEVIKVEALQRIARGPIRPAPNTAGYPDYDPGERPWNRQGNFNATNRNKLGITLDLTTEQGTDAFKELVAISDIVFTNYAFGVMDRLGLGHETLRTIKPDLIVLFTPGYGNTGPYRGHRSMGMAIDAMTGHSAMRGYPDLDLSHNSLVHHPDAVAAVTATFAINAALHYRARTGQGQFIDLSQAEAFMPHFGEVFLENQMRGAPRERRGNSHPNMSPHGCYPCMGEDAWVTIAVRSDEEWRRLCEVIGLAELTADARFGTLEGRVANRDALDALIGEWTAQRDRHDIEARLQAERIPASAVLDCGADTYDDAHLQARQYFQLVDHPDAGMYPMSGPVWATLSHTSPDAALEDAPRLPDRHEPAPGLGQHNEYLLSDMLGYAADTLRELERADVIGTVPVEGADMGGARRFARERQRSAAAS